MALTINTNVASLTAQRNLNRTSLGMNRSLQRLSSGLRINSARDDAAGLAISDRMTAQIRGLNQAARNANDGIAITQMADENLEEATNLLTRAAELAEQGASGTTSDAGRVALNAEFDQIKTAINALGTDIKFNGNTIFGGTFDAQVGDESTTDITIQASSISSTTLAVDGNHLNSRAGASAALASIQTAISTVSSSRGNLGATQSRLRTIVNSLGIQIENTQAAESQIRDADIASEVVNLTKFQILTQSGVSSLAQANASQQSVLSLLGYYERG